MRFALFTLPPGVGKSYASAISNAVGMTIRKAIGDFEIRPEHYVLEIYKSSDRLEEGIKFLVDAGDVPERLLDCVLLGMIAELGSLCEIVDLLVEVDPKCKNVRTKWSGTLQAWWHFRHDGVHRIDRLFKVSDKRGNDPESGDWLTIIQLDRTEPIITTGSTRLDLRTAVVEARAIAQEMRDVLPPGLIKWRTRTDP